MRLFLGLLVLACLFAMAATWQGRVTSDLHRAREGLRGTLVVDEASAGWSTLVLGRPSGAEPFARAADLAPERIPRPTREDGERHGPEDTRATPPAPRDPWEAAPPQRDAEYVVRSGDSLGQVVQRHYQDLRPADVPLTTLVDAVATYNGLSSPDAIRVDTLILLPHPGRLDLAR